jgi:hypothetical protein
MIEIYCPKCCTLIGYFPTAKACHDGNAGRCPFCKAPLPELGKECTTHGAAQAARQADLDKKPV